MDLGRRRTAIFLLREGEDLEARSADFARKHALSKNETATVVSMIEQHLALKQKQLDA